MKKILCLQTGILQVNTYILKLNETEAIIVDPGGSFSEIKELLTKEQLSLKACLLTHTHFDHIGAVGDVLSEFSECLLYVHKNEAFYIGKNARQNQLKDFGIGVIGAYIKKTMPASLPEPDVLLDGGEILFEDSSNFNGGFIVLHTPGHSVGSICLYCKAENLLISGDTLFANACGRTDFKGGSETEMRKSLKKLYEFPSETIVASGHGEISLLRDITKMQFFL
ncbi:MAG: MBL fold metallo-hydrolase [Treponema sp.]|jgi:glyoxylase-like metal-dependent hydrolase (beta-lactamase superfamily II)|nr:MBL fold metallo-hydrolase [Treponema sp.]